MRRRAVKDDLGDVASALRWAGALVEEAALGEDVRFGVDLCLEEALANLILHGRAPPGGKKIVLAVSADAHGALIEITDRCEPYDAANAAPPDHGDTLTEGGRGLRLMRAFATDLSYETRDGRNTLSMRIPARPAA